MASVRDRCQDFIDKARIVHGDKYEYDLVEYKTAKTKVEIKCSVHGLFEQTPDNHLRGPNGCPTCGLESRSKKRTKTHEFVIKQFEEIHKDTYGYDEVKYEKDDKPVKIKCKIHGVFKQTPNGHLAGKGCRKCGVQKMADSQRKTLDDFKKEAKEIHKYTYDYSEVKYIDYHTKIKIICKKHGVFEQSPAGHLAGHGCQKCADEYIGILNRKTKEQFIKESIEIHGDLYSYDKVDYQTQNDDIIIVCHDHGEFLQKPVVHLMGSGCQTCGSIKNADANRKSTAEFIFDAISKHGDKYNYENVDYINCRTNIIIVCSEHGEFPQTPNTHLGGGGCPECANYNIGLTNRSNKEEFVEKSIELHGSKYDYIKVAYQTSIIKVIIGCPIHGDFMQTPNGHLAGGCKKCGVDMIKDVRRKSKERFIEELIEIHGDKYGHEKVEYTNCHKDVILTCKKHGDFKVLPSNILRRDRGCPKCSTRFSKISMEWLNMIKVNYPDLRTYDDIEGEYRIPNTNYYVDGYDEKTNTVFEFHGDYWHGNPEIYQSKQINPSTKCTFGELYNKTLNKRKILEDLGYKYIEVWENKWNILKRVILKKQRSI